MANPMWPATLPPAWGVDTDAVSDDHVLRTPMDVGPAKLRPRSSGRVQSNTFSFLVTTAQKGTLETFYRTTLKKVLPFDWNDFSVTGQPAATFRFIGSPRYKSLGGGLWTAILAIEQLT